MVVAFLLILGFAQLTPSAAIAADPIFHSCGTGSSSYYTANSPYLTNIDLLSRELVRNASTTTSPSGFAKGSVIGAASGDTVYGLVLCQGDTGASGCSQCASTGFNDAQRLCTRNKEATVFYDQCVVHFSNQNFLAHVASLVQDDKISTVDLRGWADLVAAGSDWDANSTEGIAVLSGAVRTLLKETASHAAYDSAWRYATGRMDVNGTFRPLYSRAQCTPDLAPGDCWACLAYIGDTALKQLRSRGPQPRWALAVPCNLRYSTDKFYQGKPMWSIMPPPVARPSPKHKRITNKGLVIALAIPLLASIFCFTLYLKFLRRHRKVSQDEALVWGVEGRNSEFTLYNFSQVLEATANFSEENKLGQGGFGAVYKGQFPNGLEVAVKRLASHSGQGFTEFKNEILLIANLQHTNLVRLLGCSTQGQEKTLVYEYLPNKSLDFFIFDDTRRALLPWTRRLAIIEGIAQGLVYLHKHSRLRVIHRDLKASNILLDREMNPKISDFGLAKIFSTNDTEGNTRRIVGTYGYMAPEYASEGLFSVKSDVFSFGVLVLEIIIGKRTSSIHGYGDFINLLGYAWQLWNEGLWLQIVDSSLVTKVHTPEMMRCINIALLCVQENAADRPTMSHVVSMLSSESMRLPQPNHPAYFHIRVATEDVSTVVEPYSINDVTISALNGR
ncbi:hypothetical protein BS78_05G207700 [Paspalum vaginatum]|nr:hypothetical protein BS78_05G207700 [Paspalum vaginatum]